MESQVIFHKGMKLKVGNVQGLGTVVEWIVFTQQGGTKRAISIPMQLQTAMQMSQELNTAIARLTGGHKPEIIR